MNAFKMMEKIATTLKDSETITVHVAHKGAWNGAHVYEVTNNGYKFIEHVWNSYGNVRAIYKERVLNK